MTTRTTEIEVAANDLIARLHENGHGYVARELGGRLVPPRTPLSPPGDAERERDEALVYAVLDEMLCESTSDEGRARFVARIIAAVDLAHPRTAPREPDRDHWPTCPACNTEDHPEHGCAGAAHGRPECSGPVDQRSPLPASPPLAPVESGVSGRDERMEAERAVLGRTRAYAASILASCPPPSPAEGSERGRAIAKAAEAYVAALDARRGPAQDAAEATLRTALALPAGPPESDLPREVACEAYREGYDTARDEDHEDGASREDKGEAWCAEAVERLRVSDLPAIVARVLARRGR